MYMCLFDAEELLVVFFMTEAPDTRLSRMGRSVYVCNMDSLGKTCGLYREAMGVLADDGCANV